MSLPVLIIVRFYCSPRLQIMPWEGEGEGSSQAMSISTQSSSPVSPSIPPHPQSDCYPGQRVIGISWRIPSHCSPFQAQGDMLMTGSCSPPSFDGPRAAFVVHFLRYYFSPAPFPSFSSCLRCALLLLFSSLINFSLVFGSHKFQLFSALWHSPARHRERQRICLQPGAAWKFDTLV